MGTEWQEIGSRLCRHKCLITMLLLAAVLLEYMLPGNREGFCRMAICTSLIIPLAVLDAMYMMLYHKLTMSLGLAAAVTGLVLGQASLAEMAGGAGIFGGLMLGLFLLTGSLGFGDVCYGTALGACLGVEGALLGFFLTFFLGLLWAMGISLWARLFSRPIKGILPLGPFMAAGSLISMIYGKELIEWYIQGF